MYFNQIDSLRAIAVIAVILNHLNESFLPSGFLGVDVFFVISGFVVTHSLLVKTHSSALDFLKHFYIKRFKRLFPALFTCFLVSSVLGSIFIFDILSSLKTGFAAIFAHSNIYLAQKDFSYFGSDAAYNLFTHTWSLSVEEQFYFFFPLLFIFFGYLNNPQQIKRYKIAVSTLILASAAFFFLNFESNFDVAFYYMPSRLWQLMLGSLVYFYQRQHKSQYTLDILTLFILGNFMVPKEYQVYSSLAVSILTAAALIQIKNNSTLLNFSFTQTVGKYSYSLYLWHWPLMALFKYIFGATSIVAYCLILVSMSIASILSYRFIETRLRFKEWGQFKWGYLAFIPLLFFTRSQFKNISEVLYAGSRDIPYSLEDKEFRFDKCAKNKLNNPKDSYDDFKRTYLTKCTLEGKPANNHRKIFSYGSSYLQQILPALKQFDLSSSKTDVHAFYIPSCLIWQESHIEKGIGEIKACKKYYEYFRNFTLEEAKPGDSVLISVAFNKLDDYEFLSNNKKLSKQEVLKKMKSDLKLYREQLAKRGVKLYLTSSVPHLSLNPIHCTQPWSIFNSRCYSKDLVDLSKSREMLEIDKHFKNFNIIDYHTIIQTKLTNEHFGARMYFNKHHISRLANEVIYSEIESNLNSQNKKNKSF